MKEILFTVFLFLGLFISQPQGLAQRNILKHESESIDIAKSLIYDHSWIDLPSYNNRDFWQSLPADLASQYIKNAESNLTYSWPAVKATDYLEFTRSGDRMGEAFATPQSALISLVMGELMEGKGRFLDQIVNGVWFYCEQTWWGASAHLYLQKSFRGLPDVNDPTIDLSVASVANILSWTYYYFHEDFNRIHPAISSRLRQEIFRKAIDPYYQRTDFWWMGIEDQSHINNWNPYINYNILNCILLLEEDPLKKAEGVKKVIRSLDAFLNSYPDDGGCDEGPSYWGMAGAELFNSLSLLRKVTNNDFNVFENQLVQRIGQYIYKAYIHLPYFVNFADADAKTTSDPLDIYLYGKAIQDPDMQHFGAYLAQNSGWGKQPFGGRVIDQINSLVVLQELQSAPAHEVLVSHAWLPQTEVAVARDKAGSYSGFFFAAKGGHNKESHNHNDVGSFVLYYNGEPVIVDVGKEKYRAKTFSRDRYEIWNMQSQYHNLPVINGFGQLPGKEYRSKNTFFKNDRAKTIFSLDVSGAYPADAGVNRWIRKYTLVKGKSFIINDNYQLSELKGEICMNFMTCCRVKIIKPGILEMKGSEFTLQLKYDTNKVEPDIEPIEITDVSLLKFWPDGLSRVVFRIKDTGLTGEHSFIVSIAGKN